MPNKRVTWNEKRALDLLRQGKLEEAQRALNGFTLKVSGHGRGNNSAVMSATRIARHLGLEVGDWFEVECEMDGEGDRIAILRAARNETG